MPSSISSSNDRLPPGDWPKTWLAVVIVVVLACGSYEILLRQRGHRPMLNDDVGLWCRARGSVVSHDPGQVVLAGSSRIHEGLDLDVFARRFGHNPIQLAVDGTSAVPALKDLADDQTFCGVVIFDVTPSVFFSGIDSKSGQQAEFVHSYHTAGPATRLDWTLRAGVQQSLAIDLVGVRPNWLNLRDWLRAGKLPTPQYWVLRSDRAVLADYSKADVQYLRHHNAELIARAIAGMSDDRLVQGLDYVQGMVRSIQSRGGNVVFVRFPISGFMLQEEEKRFPRARYWDRLAASTSAIAINFADYPGRLAGYECPDDSHLDRADAQRFTGELAAIIRDKLGDRASLARTAAAEVKPEPHTSGNGEN